METDTVHAGSSSESESGWKQDCERTNTGLRCGPEYKDFTITARWSKSDVESTASVIKAGTGGTAYIVAFAAAKVNGPTGLSIGLISQGLSAWRDQFVIAESRGTGLNWNYTYRIERGKQRGSIINSSWSYN